MKRELSPATWPVDIADPQLMEWRKQQPPVIPVVPLPSTLPPSSVPYRLPEGQEVQKGPLSAAYLEFSARLHGQRQLADFHAYVNAGDANYNTCGQAAIASVADFYGRDPYSLPRSVDGKWWNDDDIINAIKNDGLGPDMPFGFGTSGGRIATALKRYGLDATVKWSVFGNEWSVLWNDLQSALYWGRPTPVLIDMGIAGERQPTPFGYTPLPHWPIAWRYSGGEVYLANSTVSRVPLDQFLAAWHCWYLPAGFNFCVVFCGDSTGASTNVPSVSSSSTTTESASNSVPAEDPECGQLRSRREELKKAIARVERTAVSKDPRGKPDVKNLGEKQEQLNALAKRLADAENEVSAHGCR